MSEDFSRLVATYLISRRSFMIMNTDDSDALTELVNVFGGFYSISRMFEFIIERSSMYDVDKEEYIAFIRNMIKEMIPIIEEDNKPLSDELKNIHDKMKGECRYPNDIRLQMITANLFKDFKIFELSSE